MLKRLAPLLLAVAAAGQTPVDVAVQLAAVVQPSPPAITLKWLPVNSAQSYSIFRKAIGAATWGSAVATLPGTDTAWTDYNVVADSVYEYRVQRFGNLTATGYLTAAVSGKAHHFRGTCLLVIDTMAAAGLNSELLRLMDDLRNDGWAVRRLDVAPTDDVAWIRSQIYEHYLADPALQAVFLIGHVPVPYSGNLNPDGHPDHYGAWPYDGFYGDLDGSYTDQFVNNTVASRTENWNVPGDGKWDQTTIPGNIELYVGRADFSKLPAFAESENQLLKKYLDKNHLFRNAQLPVIARALIDDNFGYFSGEAFAATGWRNFPTLVGTANVTAGDYFTDMTAGSYLWSYGCGGGSYTSASGIGNTWNFTSDSVQTVFTFLFGSYFGDWDSENNFLRAALANRGPTLANAWSGRPFWYMHFMGLGQPIGFCYLKTINNTTTYIGNYGAHWVHVALMGDPTLRMHHFAGPTELSCSGTGNAVLLEWKPAPDSSVHGYHVYRCNTPWGKYQRLTDTAMAATAYTDFSPLNGLNWYLVRAERMEQTPSGRYRNLSIGTADSITISLTTAVHAPNFPQPRLYPNPARHIVYLENLQPQTVLLLNALGKPVWTTRLNGTSAIYLPSALPAGHYVLTDAARSWHSPLIIIR